MKSIIRESIHFMHWQVQVIGFSSVNNTASLGIEGYYSSTLNGTDGKKYGYLNSDDIMEQNIVDAVDGKTVVSTIDVNIQSIVEKIYFSL